jgi:hypothetical protein
VSAVCESVPDNGERDNAAARLGMVPEQLAVREIQTDLFDRIQVEML